MRCAYVDLYHPGQQRHTCKRGSIWGVVPLPRSTRPFCYNVSINIAIWFSWTPICVISSFSGTPNKICSMLCSAAITGYWIVESNPQGSICSPPVPNPIVFRQTPNCGQMSAKSDRCVFRIYPCAVTEQKISMSIGGIDGRIQNCRPAQDGGREQGAYRDSGGKQELGLCD